MDREKIDALLQQTDLTELVEKAGGVMKVYGNGWRGACPLHKGRNETAFSIFVGDDGLHHWKCFTDCDTGGDAIEFVKMWRGLDFMQAIEYLGGDRQINPDELAKIAAERNRKAQKRAEHERRIAEKTLADLRKAERHLYYHEHAAQWAKKEWSRRGINESWQGFWFLGGCEDFVVNENYHTPTITIPIFNERREVLNIRHRLMKPQSPTDKYRPETSGLKQVPFLAIPDMGYYVDEILVVEGEIKAAVTYTVIGGMDIQVVGVPGQGMYKHLIDDLKGKKIIVCPDPGAEKPAYEFAKTVGGRMFTLPDKIDDFIIATGATENDLYQYMKYARKI